LIEPGRIGWCEMQSYVRMLLQKVFHLGGLVRG
jgi:hypothetical protein